MDQAQDSETNSNKNLLNLNSEESNDTLGCCDKSDSEKDTHENKNDNPEFKRMLIEYEKIMGTYVPEEKPNDISAPSMSYLPVINTHSSLFDFDQDFDSVEAPDEFLEALCFLSKPRLVVYKKEVVLLYIVPEKNISSTNLFKKAECNDFDLVFKRFLKNTKVTIPFSRINRCLREHENVFSIAYTSNASNKVDMVTTKLAEECEDLTIAINVMKNY